MTKCLKLRIFTVVNVLEKLVKPSVRRAPEGAFRYVKGIMDKPFKTYTELLDFLEKEKRLSIPDRAMAEEILSKTGYYSLITGYKELFKDKTTGYYKKDVRFDDIYRVCESFSVNEIS